TIGRKFGSIERWGARACVGPLAQRHGADARISMWETVTSWACVPTVSMKRSCMSTTRPSVFPSIPPLSRSLPPPGRKSTMAPPRRSVPPAAFAVAAATLFPACAVATRSQPPPAVNGVPMTLAQLGDFTGAINEVQAGHLQIRDAHAEAHAEVSTPD